MKTIKLTRTIRREIDGMFVYIGPKGIGFRSKHHPKRETFELTWKQAYVRALLFAADEERQRLQPIVEIKPEVVEDPKQMPMFPVVHNADEAIKYLDTHPGGIGIDYTGMSPEEVKIEQEKLDTLLEERERNSHRRSAWISPPPPNDAFNDKETYEKE